MENKDQPLPISRRSGSEKICVRFAPSPTGFLHLGGARTALYNWLLARQRKGIFLLRIEDTDVERSEERFWKQILEDLKWLGLDWDQDPFFQHGRKELYTKYAQILLEHQMAYYCFCSAEELAKQRTGTPFGYDGRCRQIPHSEALERIQKGEAASIRFRVPDSGRVEFRDLVRGKIRVENKEIDDFIIVRSNGEPTYNLAVVVDDALMKVTHVIRGDDHISNTPKQIMLYRSLDFPCPTFAHIPMIMGPDRTRLSKRHGAVAVGWYREMGYLPQALVNYLALLGWSYDGQQTIFSTAELIEKFDLKKVSKKAAIFDPVKLDWMNGKYIRQLDESQYLPLALSHLHKAGLESIPKLPSDTVIRILMSVKDKLKKFSDLPGLVDFFFVDSITLTEKAQHQTFDRKDNFFWLKELYDRLSGLDTFTEPALEKVFQSMVREKGLKLADLAHPVRAAITGKTASPGLFLTMHLLGKNRTLSRLADILRQFEAV